MRQSKEDLCGLPWIAMDSRFFKLSTSGSPAVSRCLCLVSKALRKLGYDASDFVQRAPGKGFNGTFNVDRR